VRHLGFRIRDRSQGHPARPRPHDTGARAGRRPRGAARRTPGEPPLNPWRAIAGALLLACVACSSGPALAPAAVPVEIPAEAAEQFGERIASFYSLLQGRRFNTLDTFHDPALRGYFETEERFLDYYADLSQDLELGHFEKSRPDRVRVTEFVFDSSERARVRVEFVGEERRPLRPDSSEIARIDRWERAGDVWYLVPEKL
jgi:hypothetical protein